MKLTNVASIRLLNQQIEGGKFNKISSLVSWMGAMQAQDYSMAKWAIGLRVPNSTEDDVQAAIDSGEIIRTHLLRPTWHFVSPGDIHWMLDLSASRIKASMKSRDRELELTSKIYKKANGIFEKVLREGNHLTRSELLSHLPKSKIIINNYRSYHLLLNAELDGIICSGKSRAKQITYALLSERVPSYKKLNREEALATLAQKYFESHCPATIQDFIWWSGLSATEAKQAVELVNSFLTFKEIDGQAYFFPASFTIPQHFKKSAFLLPAFDEFLISYKNRSAALELQHQTKTFSNNGIFWPTIVVNGQVSGTWKRTIRRNAVVIELNYFEKPVKVIKQMLELASAKFGSFLNKKIEVVHSIYH